MTNNLSNLETHLAAAVEIDDQAERDAYLRSACEGDSLRLIELQAMVRDYFAAGSLLDRPAILAPTLDVSNQPDVDGQPEVGTCIGPYKLRELLGEGGMGSVYVAEQQTPVRRKVALKVIKAGMDSRQVISRFEAERQALALMEHTNIARVLDAGTTSPTHDGCRGRPYFVMELVKGESISEHCDHADLTTRQRLELFLQVCRAVQHAHQKGVIHRDLKPSNILVTLHDTLPVVKVIDFGVAKAIGQQLTEGTLYTGFAQLVGTPLYMSPEQAGLSGLDVDTRSDIYSLGVLLYELLTGTTPFNGETLRQVGVDEIRRIIREVDPPRPSARVSTLQAAALSTIAERRHVQPQQLGRQLRGELDWIVMKALEKDRTRRYETVGALLEDVERYLSDEPVKACPPSVVYRMQKLTRRNSLALATGVSVAAALVLGSGVSLWQANEAIESRKIADLHLANEQLARRESQEREAELRLQLYARDMSIAWKNWNSGDTTSALSLLEQQLPLGEQIDLRDFAWNYLNSICHARLLAIQGDDAPLLTADVSPDNRLIASGDRGGTLKIWDLEHGTELKDLRYSAQEITSVAFSPDGRILAAAGQDRTIRLWTVETWEELFCLRGHGMTICSVAWSPDGRQLASGARDQEVRIWDIATGQQLQCLTDHFDVIRCVAWSPDSNILAAAEGRRVRLWDAKNWQPLGDLGGHDKPIQRLAFSPNGKLLVSAGYDRRIIVHDVAEQRDAVRAEATGVVWSLTFSPDGSLLLAGVGDGGPNVWALREGAKRLEFLRGGMEQGGTQRSLVFARNGKAIVTALEEQRSVTVWPIVSLLGHKVHRFNSDCVAVNDQRDLAITASDDGSLRIHTFSSGDIQATLPGHHTGPLWRAKFSPAGDIFATSGRDAQVFLWDARTFQLLHRLEVEAPAFPTLSLSFSPDGELLAGGNDMGKVRLWNTSTGSVQFDLQAAAEEGMTTAFSPDGKTLATASGAKSGVQLWQVASGLQVGTFEANQTFYGLTFTPDGNLLVGGGRTGVFVWDVASRSQVHHWMGHRSAVVEVGVSPDGQTLATIGDDHTLRLWHIRTGHELFTLFRHDHLMRWLQFTSSQKLLLGTSFDDAPLYGVVVFDANPFYLPP